MGCVLVCGGCDPETCEPPRPCEGVCRGDYPFSCAEHLPGASVVKYGCHRDGGCFYMTSADDAYPYDEENWCTYRLVDESSGGGGRNLLRGRSKVRDG